MIESLDFRPDFSLSELLGQMWLDLSGGGQGGRPKPVPKIRGTQDKWKREKVQVVKKPIIRWIPPWKKK